MKNLITLLFYDKAASSSIAEHHYHYSSTVVSASSSRRVSSSRVSTSTGTVSGTRYGTVPVRYRYQVFFSHAAKRIKQKRRTDTQTKFRD
ncbi:hypothetical protein FisN_33Lu017 [Fistulifera solaris]|uniref:Uncharacterized protein n=1 Tax=Fistulifera solaris TaxID=1519565 RepID=A0A1Z5KB13_FISSO|nr:hypothetical protein FisN_33Lu017 [Fistulifera solaris]|eukprot:GAX23128.1 hypothetical protein FisN_33Lu017 [Fistulifera solaris]